MVWWVGAALAQNAPLEITVTDPKVHTVVLTCGRERLESAVRAGVAVFASAPSGCAVEMIRTGGHIAGPGKWTCGLDSCAQDDVHHLPVSDAPKRVNVIVSTPMPAGTGLEVACADGSYRERRTLVENTATFDGVPSEDCTLLFKGGVPAKYQPLKYGTWYCSLTGATAVCTRR
jgi:hypothetical protein